MPLSRCTAGGDGKRCQLVGNHEGRDHQFAPDGVPGPPSPPYRPPDDADTRRAGGEKVRLLAEEATRRINNLYQWIDREEAENERLKAALAAGEAALRASEAREAALREMLAEARAWWTENQGYRSVKPRWADARGGGGSD
jgi:hypothetical protein